MKNNHRLNLALLTGLPIVILFHCADAPTESRIAKFDNPKLCSQALVYACCPSTDNTFKVEIGTNGCHEFRSGCFKDYSVDEGSVPSSKANQSEKGKTCKVKAEVSPPVSPINPPLPRPTPRPEVWFTPNVGSKDLLALYSNPDAWKNARSQIHVMKHYSANVMGNQTCVMCNGNNGDAMVTAEIYRKLASWGIELAAEVGVLKPENSICSITNTSPRYTFMDLLTKKAEANGGRLSRISIDENMYAGMRKDVSNPCNLTANQAATEFIKFFREVNRRWPTVKIGAIEPYPGGLPATTALAIKTYLSTVAQAGLKLDHFHIDIDNDALKTGWELEITDVLNHAKKLGIPTGIIFMSPVADGSEDFVKRQQENIQRYKSLIPLIDHAIFQSWAITLPVSPTSSKIYPDNLPESGPSMTSALLQGLKVVKALISNPK